MREGESSHISLCERCDIGLIDSVTTGVQICGVNPELMNGGL